MNLPEVADSIIMNRQEIFDSGVRIASTLVGGQDILVHALEMKKIESEIIGNLSEEEKQAYFGREDAFEPLTVTAGEWEEKYGEKWEEDWARLERDLEKIAEAYENLGPDDPTPNLEDLDLETEPERRAEHDKVIEIAEKAPLIASNRVTDVGGFVLGAIEPPLHIVKNLYLPPMAPKGVLLQDMGELVKGEEITSQRARHLRIAITFGTILRFEQYNTSVRRDEVEHEWDVPHPEKVAPEIELNEINDYLIRYAKTLQDMESLPLAELQEAISPHLAPR